MFDFFRPFNNNSNTSKNVAKERLKLVLVHDRIDCSPQLLEAIKDDILKVISSYAEIDEEGLEIKMSKTRSETDDKPVSALVANIPLKNIKERKRISLESIKDNHYGLVNEQIAKFLKIDQTLEEEYQLIKTLTPSDISDFASRMYLDTIYFLGGNKNGK